MADNVSRILSGFNGVHSARLFRRAMIAVVCVAVAASFWIGLARGLADSVGLASWGRILFGAGAAITKMAHGGYGYTISEVVEGLLAQGGLTSDPAILSKLGTTFPDNLKDPALINAAFDKAAHFKLPFDPTVNVRGSSGDDVGFVDFTRIGFRLFGYKIQSLYFTYFLILGVSLAAFVYQFRERAVPLAILATVTVAQTVLFSSGLLDTQRLGMIGDPRFLSTLAVVPGLHLAYLMLDRVEPSDRGLALAGAQSIILVFILHVRVSAVWILLGLVLIGAVVSIQELRKRRFAPIWLWSLGILAAVLYMQSFYVSATLHPVYRAKGEITRHVLWHAVFYSLQFHPDWKAKYAARFDNTAYDELPPTAAKQYLLRHPPADPRAVYLTEDRKYLKMAAAETYIRKAFIEFAASDPKFAFEAVFIYNPLKIGRVLLDLTLSLGRFTALAWMALGALAIGVAGLIAADGGRYRGYAWGAALVAGAFCVSLGPLIPTAPDYNTMADQFFLLLAALGCLCVLALATGLRACLRPASGHAA